jgi:uncharacterized protein YecE (DUF72 family)
VSNLRIGTAGWTIPRQDAHAFPAAGSSLQRYAARFNAVEINSSFHRPHRPATWERWRDSVPAGFRFSVKLAKEITHERKLRDCAEPLARFLDQVSILGDKLAVILVQLPPKHEFDERGAGAFLAELRQRSHADIVCEPRHQSWFTPVADALLVSLNVARVAADPAICNDAGVPGGWRGLSYWRLHGSPVIYRSSYLDRIPTYADRLRGELEDRDVWCIFDNTASSAGAGDALALMDACAMR